MVVLFTPTCTSLILYGGYDFERSIIKLFKASSNAASIAIHEVAVPKPIIGVRMVEVIRNNLEKVSPSERSVICKECRKSYRGN